MPGFLICLLLITGGALNRPPALHTPTELAKYADCKPDRIAYWLGSISYAKTDEWPTSEAVMERGATDCKGYATVAEDTLDVCGYYSHITVVHGEGHDVNHAFTVYEGKDGRRGYINGSGQREFAAGTDWGEIIKAVPGGPWEEI